MQTFLPFPDFTESAKSLDYRRLGKQRVETKQIYFALTRPDYGWKNHPIVKMWKGYENALLKYGIDICSEWRSRGYKDNQLVFFLTELTNSKIVLPPWIGDDALHTSHKSNLIRKYPEYYSKQFPNVPDNLPYIWK